MAPLFQRDVVIIGHPVKTVDAKTFRQQQLRQVKTDETGGARYQNAAISGCGCVLHRAFYSGGMIERHGA